MRTGHGIAVLLRLTAHAQLWLADVLDHRPRHRPNQVDEPGKGARTARPAPTVPAAPTITAAPLAPTAPATPAAPMAPMAPATPAPPTAPAEATRPAPAPLTPDNTGVAKAVLAVADRLANQELVRRLHKAVGGFDGIAVIAPEPGDAFDPLTHRWTDTRKAARRDDHERVAELLAPGFTGPTGTVIRPAQVAVYDNEGE
ncbi:nucleotide exchange factor GrpE [Streptomyces sp. SID4919]|uniref:nucleotide exchange factor GrpE n=1 Tax=unclassified Streptomyces TaxID=2593676 RepID=UPI000823793B|nr:MULTISPECIES: nucleotide exchange factor GrpE [unclassified Streptomyces]MYY13799.1 nucleotide exchange factor GrpE [Streptomyces sp. SID4919]SCK30380.1 Molecular chaperone GrpE (heat shock protein) [Streptomyces sp. AmelKG-E11A]